MNKITLKAEKRSVTGRKVKKLRREGMLPANLFGKKIKSESIQLPVNEFMAAYKEAGETGLIELTLGGTKRPVLVSNLQVDPVTDIAIHADLLQVDLKEKVTAEVPVELVGESPAEKQGLGTVVQYVDEIEVEALPGDLPDKFEVDLSNLTEVDQNIFVKDLVSDSKKVEIKADLDQIVVKVEPQKVEEEVVTPPAEGEGTAEEGEAVPAEAGEELQKEEASGESKSDKE
jgi:large subunit ribosomal protein L25